MPIFEANQLPTRAGAIAAICGQRKHAQQREQPRRVEERRVIDRSQVVDLLLGRERRERCGAAMLLAKRRLKPGELGAIVAGELRKKRRQRPVDEVDDAGLAGARRVVRRNDLCGDGFNVGGFSRAEK
jgi:hypothetical protein